MTTHTIKPNPATGPRIVISRWRALHNDERCQGNALRVQGVSGNDARRMALLNTGPRDSAWVQQEPRGLRLENGDLERVLVAARELADLWDLPVVSNDPATLS